MSKIRRMFPGGNTSEGFYSYHKYIGNNNLKKIFILKGSPGSGKSTLMSQIGEMMRSDGHNIEYHHCPSDKDSVDGLVVCDLKIAILDGTSPHMIDPELPGIVDEIIDLGKYINSKRIVKYKKEIVEAKKNNKKCYRRTYAYFRAAKEVLDEIVKNNCETVEFGEINKIINELIEEIYGQKDKKIIIGRERHLFSRAFTPDGLVDHTDTLINNIEKVYFVKGEYGTGKSTLLKEIYKEGIVRGFNVEVFHEPLIPQKIGTIVIPELNVAITTSILAENDCYKSIDLNRYFNSRFKIEEDYKMFSNLIDAGINSLYGARKNHDILENLYHQAIDFEGIASEKENIIKRIQSLQ